MRLGKFLRQSRMNCSFGEIFRGMVVFLFCFIEVVLDVGDFEFDVLFCFLQIRQEGFGRFSTCSEEVFKNVSDIEGVVLGNCDAFDARGVGVVGRSDGGGSFKDWLIRYKSFHGLLRIQ